MHVFNDVCLLGLLSNLIGRDLIVILIVGVLIFFGVRNLPDIMRAIRRLPSAFRKGLHDEENSKPARDKPPEDPKTQTDVNKPDYPNHASIQGNFKGGTIVKLLP